jgi:YegS/Rv2252/BmrU family lipid kinase
LTTFLVNPASAGGATGKQWPELERRAAALGLEGRSLLSERPGHLTELAARAIAEGERRLVVVGGDGTAFEALNGLLEADAPDADLAFLPRGTGRDFARSLGLPKRFDDAVVVARSGDVRAIDAGRATFTHGGTTGSAWFANIAGAGISGAIAHRANTSSKVLGGRLSFLVATVAVFARWKSAHVQAVTDAGTRSGQMFEVVAMNGAYAAGGMRIAPDAALDDGLLDCVFFGDVTKVDFATTFPKIYAGRHLSHPKIDLVRTRVVRIDADPPLPVVLDGEQPGTTPAEFELVPRALRVRVPTRSS